ncbi:MAG TPA: hypothetical protein VF927_03135 [Solirubrobacteraceae bacterium]
MRRLILLACIACWLVSAAPAGANATTSSAAATASTAGSASPAAGTGASGATSTNNPDAPVPVGPSNIPPAGRRLSANQVIAIAERLPKVEQARREYPGSYGGAYLKPAFHWQVSYFSKSGRKEIAQVIIDDLSGRVLEQWTGFQVAWTMARGYPGAFGRHVNSLYVWLPLCVLFLLPFWNFRRPFSLLHLDLLVLLSFSVSLAYFNHAHIYASVPLAYPPLLYLLARMLALLRRPRDGGTSGRQERPLRLLVPASWLAVAVVFLIGFRVALNVTDSNVVDVGYAGVIGADRIVHGRALYGNYPSDNEHGDTYGPVNYEVYVPFREAFGWSGTWDDLPASHAAAIFFDLLAVGLLFLIGRRMRGPTLGIALAYAWVSFPFTLFALESNSNDTLVAALVLAAVLAASYRSLAAGAARGALSAMAGLTKFAPLALAPLLAIDALRGVPARRRPLMCALFVLGFAGAGALAFIPALAHDSLSTIYRRTIEYQGNRGSPFSVWGLYGLNALQHVTEGMAFALAIVIALIPRRGDLVGLAAGCAAILIGAELAIEHWFYLYIVWFFPLVMLALLGRFSAPLRRAPDEASTPARSSRPAAALSS